MSLTVVSRPEVTVRSKVSRLVSIIQAILYNFRREDFAVFSVQNNGGFAEFVISGDITSEVKIGDLIFSGVTNYIGATSLTAVVFSTPNTLCKTQLTFAGSETGYMNDLTAKPNYFVDFIIRTIGRDVVDADLVVNPRVEPFSDGTLAFDVSPFLQDEVDPDEAPDLTDLNNFYAKRDVRFFIKYRENWTGSSESQTLDSSFEFNALIAVKQIGETNTMNLVEYVPMDDESFPAKWLIDLIQPKFYPDYQFHLMFYFPENTIFDDVNNVRIEIQLDINGNYLSDTSDAIASHKEGINYMKIAEGYATNVKFVDVFIASTIPLSTAVGTTFQPLDIFFLPNTLIGWTCGASGKVWKTIDGAETWPEVADTGSGTVRRIRFADEDNGYIVEANQLGVEKTVDGGVNWTDITPVASRNYFGLFVWDKNRLIVLDEFSTGSHLSDDAGVTWKLLVHKTFFIKNGVFFWDINRGIVVGNGGNIEWTDNHGAEWHTSSTPGISEDLADVHGWPNGAAIVSGNGRIARTEDYGKTWVSVDATAGGGDRIAFTSNDAVVYVLKQISNQMMVSYDQGRTWATETIGSADVPNCGATIKDRLHIGSSSSVIRNTGHIVVEIKRIEIIHEDCPSPFYIRFNNRRGGNTWWMFALNQVFTTDNSFEEVLLQDDTLNDNEYESLVQLNTPNEITDLSTRDLDGVKKLQEQGMIAVNQVDKEGNEIGLVVLEQAQAKESISSVHQIDIIVQKPEKQRLL